MEQKNNSGVAFKNNYKERETQPDFKGNVIVNGTPMDVAMWVKKDKNGNDYFSFSFSEPYVKKDEPQSAPSTSNDDLPF